jgi:hypothetical protein
MARRLNTIGALAATAHQNRTGGQEVRRSGGQEIYSFGNVLAEMLPFRFACRTGVKFCDGFEQKRMNRIPPDLLFCF